MPNALTHRKSIPFFAYPLAVFALSVFAIIGCSDDDPQPEATTVSDLDGNVYQTVIIGDQHWMAENLRVARYNNGDSIAAGLSNAEWKDTADGALAVYDHDAWNTGDINSREAMVEAYGKLYNWYAVTDSRGICPEGWRVPGDDDWAELINEVVSQGYANDDWEDINGAGNALKSCRQIGSDLEGCNTSEHPRWHEDETHMAFDAFGFSALPAGSRSSGGVFNSIGSYGDYWSTTENNSATAWYRGMRGSSGSVFRMYNSKVSGFSVRCIRDQGK